MSGSLSSRWRSVRCALAGVAFLVRSQPNARIHTAVTVAVVGLGAWLGLSRFEWCWLAVAIAAVWTAEALNTAIELIADEVCSDHHPRIGQAKDVAAAGVLAAAAGSAVIGALVLGPHLLQWLGIASM